MSLIDRRNTLSHIQVSEAMRRLVVALPKSASIEQAVRYTIKFKVNAILVTDEKQEGVGVVSKTDLMGAYYAGLPIESAVDTIMVGPPLFCRAEDSLESALDSMRSSRIHRLYVLGGDPEKVVGVVAYPDVVGMLYRFCRKCDRNTLRIGKRKEGDHSVDTYRVVEVMTPSVQAHQEDETIMEVMEGLSSHHLGAVLIRSRQGLPVGVVSKTDLMIAYRHGVSPEGRASGVMSYPVRACDQNEHLVEAIRQMIFSDVHRVFVYKDLPPNILGVLSLSDAARVRSGSCRACVTSRITV
jgi:signal-transduction protein with cAMP-binding, CBS, and nucleotidyltransferase domain